MSNLALNSPQTSQPTLFDLDSSDLGESLANRKARFLHSLKGKSLTYKRYTKSPLRYGGGKSLAVGLILEHFPNDIQRVVSPFIGGGSVEVASALELELEVKAYDIFDILVNFWNVTTTQSSALYTELENLEPSKEVYEQIKNELKAHYKKFANLDNLTLARDYYFNFNLSYGPGFLGWMSKIYEDKARYKNMLKKLRDFGAHSGAQNLVVECASFEAVFEKYPNDFFTATRPIS